MPGRPCQQTVHYQPCGESALLERRRIEIDVIAIERHANKRLARNRFMDVKSGRVAGSEGGYITFRFISIASSRDASADFLYGNDINIRAGVRPGMTGRLFHGRSLHLVFIVARRPISTIDQAGFS